MGTLKQLISDLRDMPKRIKQASQSVLDKEIPKLIVDLKRRSPVDTGQYKSSWRSASPRFSSVSIIASVGIINDDPKAGVMNEGLAPEAAPWYFPNQKKPTGKLIESGGRIWAGGFNPGHSFTIGGAINPVILNNNERQLQIANSIAASIMRII